MPVTLDNDANAQAFLTNICYPAEIRRVATDEELDSDFKDEFSAAGIDLILAR